MKKSVAIIIIVVLLVGLGLALWLFGCFGANQIEVGDVTEFGGIQWRVLDVQDNRALLLAEYLLEFRVYHDTPQDVTWETSRIRQWLNDEFYNRFSDGERERIVETVLENKDNQWWGTPGGNDTVDKIFLLSMDEVVRYFVPVEVHDGFDLWNDERYLDERSATFENGIFGHWWLRSPGSAPVTASIIAYTGQLGEMNVAFSQIGVRPGMWIYTN